MLIAITYLDLADILMFYCDYNKAMNIVCIHIGIFKSWEKKKDIALGNGTDIRRLATDDKTLYIHNNLSTNTSDKISTMSWNESCIVISRCLDLYPLRFKLTVLGAQLSYLSRHWVSNLLVVSR